MPEFTKGKWDFIEWPVSSDKEEKQKYLIGSPKRAIGFIFHEADARLIAAAPELYEAVHDLLDYAYEALHWAGGENEIRGKAPRILHDIQEYQELLARIAGKDTSHDE